MTADEFRSALEQAIDAARQAATDEDSPGDPGTHVSYSADGRCGFARTFKNHAPQTGSKYTFPSIPVTLHEDNSLHLDVLQGTDIQHHQKKRAAYRAFAEEMEKQGYTVGLDESSYAR